MSIAYKASIFLFLARKSKIQVKRKKMGFAPYNYFCHYSASQLLNPLYSHIIYNIYYMK